MVEERATDQEKEFYVGYLPTAPAGLARWLKPKIALLVALPLVIAALLTLSQGDFGPGVLEFQKYRDFEGVLIEQPCPMIRLDRPGWIPVAATALPSGEHASDDGPPTAPTAGHSLYYLTVFGKHGAHDLVAGRHGRRARLRGALIYRADQTMIEVQDGSVVVLPDPAITIASGVVLGEVTLAGEIVDSKCFLGVMKPGNLKPHKSCAIRCISGGVPPVLVVRDAEGDARYLLLTGPAGQSINREVLDLVAEPVSVTGRLERQDNLWVLRVDPADFRLL